jgi:hypothetical protein
VAELVARFPELDDPHWRACAAPVSRS